MQALAAEIRQDYDGEKAKELREAFEDFQEVLKDALLVLQQESLVLNGDYPNIFYVPSEDSPLLLWTSGEFFIFIKYRNFQLKLSPDFYAPRDSGLPRFIKAYLKKPDAKKQVRVLKEFKKFLKMKITHIDRIIAFHDSLQSHLDISFKEAPPETVDLAHPSFHYPGVATKMSRAEKKRERAREKRIKMHEDQKAAALKRFNSLVKAFFTISI